VLTHRTADQPKPESGFRFVEDLDGHCCIEATLARGRAW
jgi:hypothetical protein